MCELKLMLMHMYQAVELRTVYNMRLRNHRTASLDYIAPLATSELMSILSQHRRIEEHAAAWSCSSSSSF